VQVLASEYYTSIYHPSPADMARHFARVHRQQRAQVAKQKLQGDAHGKPLPPPAPASPIPYRYHLQTPPPSPPPGAVRALDERVRHMELSEFSFVFIEHVTSIRTAASSAAASLLYGDQGSNGAHSAEEKKQ
jgi:hypothetical protein